MEDSNSNNSLGTWGTLVGVVGGAALGYWAGRSSETGPNYGAYPAAMAASPLASTAVSGFTGFEAGKTQAELSCGLNYTALGIGAIRQDINAVSGQISAGFQNIMDRQFQQLISENQALKGEIYMSNALSPVKTELAGIGCAVGCLKQNQVSAFRAVPLCTTCPTSTTTTAS